MLSFDTKIHKQEGTGTYDLLELKINTISSSVLNLNVDLSPTWKRQCMFLIFELYENSPTTDALLLKRKT